MKNGTTDAKKREPVVKPPCSIPDCGKQSFARGWCRTHYGRWYETGSTELGVRNAPKHPPAATPRPIADRFWEKVEKTDNHWWWTGSKTKLGYGSIWDNDQKRRVMAHRLSWELANGEYIPSFLVIDHLCRQPSCVNPDHLEVVTVSINTERGLAPALSAARSRSKTHCPQGHPYSKENTYLYREGRTRVCRTCAIERTQERRRKAAGG